MATRDHNEDRRERKAEHHDEFDRRTRGSSLWWSVWIPIIVVVTLWIGGWWFGNYGGPWTSKPAHLENPKISDPAIFIGTFR